MRSVVQLIFSIIITSILLGCGDNEVINNNPGATSGDSLLVNIDSFSLRPQQLGDTLYLDILSNIQYPPYDTLRFEFTCSTNDTTDVECSFRIPDHETINQIHNYTLNGTELNSQFRYTCKRYYYVTDSYLYLYRFAANPGSWILCRNIKVWKVKN
jgi:hypothetical protein